MNYFKKIIILNIYIILLYVYKYKNIIKYINLKSYVKIVESQFFFKY